MVIRLNWFYNWCMTIYILLYFYRIYSKNVLNKWVIYSIIGTHLPIHQCLLTTMKKSLTTRVLNKHRDVMRWEGGARVLRLLFIINYYGFERARSPASGQNRLDDICTEKRKSRRKTLKIKPWIFIGLWRVLVTAVFSARRASWPQQRACILVAVFPKAYKGYCKITILLPRSLNGSLG